MNYSDIAKKIVDDTIKLAEEKSNGNEYSYFQGAIQAEIENLLDKRKFIRNLKNKINELEKNGQMNKAREQKQINKSKKIQIYQKKINKIIKNNNKIKTKELIEKLEINNKTFYNLELNKYLKSVK